MANTTKPELKPLQIVSSESENTVNVDLETLKTILCRDDLKNRFISIISVNGTFRQGKSFFLNFLLRYLRVKYTQKKNVSDWLKPEDGPIQGFPFVCGTKRHTTGIQMWPEIFYTTLPSGENAAILLLDTQGSFDTESSMNNCSNIFALSTLISSVQICNIMRGIKKYDLSHLEVFGGYSTLMQSNESAFQSLWFLIRDWPCDYEHPYGHSGGLSYLEEVFRSGGEEMKGHVDNVKSLFREMNCFLLPYPGRQVDCSKNFKGDLDDMDEEFRSHIEDFVPLLLAPENLVLKEINGEKKTAAELIHYIEEYSNILKEGQLPKIQTIYKATIEAHYKALSDKFLKFYKKHMDMDLQYRFLRRPDFRRTHERSRSYAIENFDSEKKFEDDQLYNKYLVILQNKIEELHDNYKKDNELKLRQHEEEEARKKREQAKKEQEQIRRELQQRNSQSAGGSGLSQVSAEGIGTAVAVVGAGAALAYGLMKAFSGSRNND